VKISSAKDFIDLLTRVINTEWGILVDTEGEKLAKQFHERVEQVIKRQEILWPPLKAGYMADKIRAGLDSRMLIARGTYVNSFEHNRVNQSTWRAGVKPVRHPDSGLPMEIHGAVHEYGSPGRGIPARPHWGPIKKEFQGKKAQIEKDLIRQLSQRIRARLKSELGSM
jgi:hypothetical protein